MRTYLDFFRDSGNLVDAIFSRLYRAVGWVVRLSLFPTSVKILKVLGEGGFSFVYLCQDEVSGVGFAF